MQNHFPARLPWVIMASIAVTLLAACGTSASDLPSVPQRPQTASSANVTPARYQPGAASATIFNALNAYRTQCGFPAYAENLTLDRAAQAHAVYMVDNDGLSTDVEVAAGKHFVGVTYGARATHFGYPPSGVGVGGVVNSYVRSVTLDDPQYGAGLLDGWIAGVYHAWIVASPLTELGIGYEKTLDQGHTKALSNLTVADLEPMQGDVPLTFPCEGTSGVPYRGSDEFPLPPNTHGAWGTPITLSGNPFDQLTLSSATLMDSAGTKLVLQVLDYRTDPNREVEPYWAVAYPTEPLAPQSTYTATLVGTINGKPYTRRFTFETRAVVD